MMAKLTAMVGMSLLSLGAVAPGVCQAALNPRVAERLEAATHEFGQISPERRNALEQIASYVAGRLAAEAEANLNFICTHNSRRSQMSQVWARIAAEYYGLGRVKTFSGGTSVTACNPRTVATLKRAGLEIKQTAENGGNPIYAVSYAADREPLTLFSKMYNAASNPQNDFCAVMTCEQADKNCPIVTGAVLRVGLPYEDPKKHDNTSSETEQYDQRNQQIAREMLYLFSKVKSAQLDGKRD